jgi:HK97 family phage major capsid protein
VSTAATLTKRQLVKALGIGSAGAGAEVTLQQTIASEVIPLIRQQCFMRQIAEKSKTLINMTKPRIRVPKMVRAQGVYGVEEGKPAPEFKARLDGVDLDPQKLMVWLPFNQEVFEDSTITDIEGILKEEMAREFAQGEEIAWVRGDRTQNFGDGDPRNLFNGLLPSAAASPHTWDNTLDAADGQVVVSNLIRAKYNLGVYGRSSKDVIFMVGTRYEEALLRNKTFQTQATYAFGSGAGIFNGEIGKLAGSPVISTTFLDAQPGEPYGKALVFNASCFAIGDWKNFNINVYNQILAQTDQVAIRARERVAFAIRYAEAIVQILNCPAQP